MQDDIPIWQNPNRNPPPPTDDDIPVWVNPNRNPPPPVTPAPPPISIPTPYGTFGNYRVPAPQRSHGAILDALYNYGIEGVKRVGEIAKGMAEYPGSDLARQQKGLELAKTDPVKAQQQVEQTYGAAQQFTQQHPIQTVASIGSEADPTGISQTEMSLGKQVGSDIGTRNYGGATVNAGLMTLPFLAPFLSKNKTVGTAPPEVLPAEPPGPPKQIGGNVQPVDPVIEAEFHRTYNGPRQLGTGPMDPYGGYRQALPTEPRQLPAVGETTPTDTFYQGAAGTTRASGNYLADITEPSRVPGWDTTPEGEVIPQDPARVAEQGPGIGKLARSIAINAPDQIPTLENPAGGEKNYPIGVETEQATATEETPVEKNVEPPAEKPETPSTKYKATTENGETTVVDTETNEVVLKTASPKVVEFFIKALPPGSVSETTVEPPVEQPSTAIQPTKPVETRPATLPFGTEKLEEVQGENPFQLSTQPIEEPPTPRSIAGRILPSATKPVLRVGGEIPKDQPVLSGRGVEPVGSVLRRETLTPEEAAAVKPPIEGEPVPPGTQELPPETEIPWRRETVTAGEGAAAVREARAPDLAKQAVVDEAAKVARVAERAAQAAEKAAAKDPNDAAKAEAAKLARTKANSAQDRATKIEEAAKNPTKSVSDITGAKTPVLKPGQAAPGDDVRAITAEYGSPDRVLAAHPETAPIAKLIKEAKVSKDYWVRTTLEKLNPFLKGLNTAGRIAIGKILDTGETAGVSPDLVSRAQGIRAILDDIHQNIQDVPGGKPTVGYITNYFTHMEKGERPGVWRSTVNLFKSNKLPKTLGSGVGDMYSTGIGNPDSPYVKTRTGQLTQIDYDIRNVLPKYVESIGEYKFDKPAVLEAKKILGKVPDDTIIKELANWYLTNYTRYDSAPQLHTAFENWASAVANRTARSWIDLNRGLHVLHLAELPFSVIPELGGVKYTGIGMGKVIANPVKTFTELARLGLLQGEAKPLAFRTAAEKWRSAAQFFSVAETLVKGTAYEGAKQMYLDKGYSPAEAASEAVNLTKRSTFVVDPSTQMKGLSPEANVGGGEVLSKLGWQFKGAPLKIIENLITTTLEARKDPAKAARMLTGTLAMIGTAKLGARTFHMNLADIAGTTIGGAFGTVAKQIVEDVYKGDLVKLGIDLAAWGVPGGQQIKGLITPSKPNKTSQNIPGASPVGSVLGGGLQAKVMGDKGINEVNPVKDRPTFGDKGDFQSEGSVYGAMDEEKVRDKFRELYLRGESERENSEWRDNLIPPDNPGTMPTVRPPAEFQKDPIVVDTENAKRIYDVIRKVAPQYMDKVKLISRAPTTGSMRAYTASHLPMDATGTTLMGLTDKHKEPYELYIAPDMPDSLNTLIHEMMHVGGADHDEINPFLEQAFIKSAPGEYVKGGTKPVNRMRQ